MFSQKLIKLLSQIVITSLFIFSCSKSSTNSNNNTIGGSGSVTDGPLFFNVSWNIPTPTPACTLPCNVNIEINGPSNYNYHGGSFTVSPQEIRLRLNAGNYNYKVTKSPRSSCATFSTVIKTGVFTILACPIGCPDATRINVVVD